LSSSIDFNKAAYIKSVGYAEALDGQQGREVAVTGRSNVGKSSIINGLCNRKSLARVSSTPGKTTTVNFYSIGKGYLLTDLPGYGYAKRSDAEKRRWSGMMEHYFNSGREIALVVQLIDIRHAPTDDDIQMIDFLTATGLPFLAVLTKKDKLSKSAVVERLNDFAVLLKPYNPLELLAVSIKDVESITGLRDSICALTVKDSSL